MNKNLLLPLLLIVSTLFTNVSWAQYSTGLVELYEHSSLPENFMSAEISTDASKVTVKMVGTASRFMAIGFGATTMLCDDVIFYDDLTKTIIDGYNNRRNIGIDATNDWTMLSNEVSEDGVRTVIAERNLTSGTETTDYVFTNSENQSLHVIWALGYGENINWGHFARGTYQFTDFESTTLSVPTNTLNDKFSIAPNPTSGDLTIASHVIDVESVAVFDLSGKNVANFEIPQAEYSSSKLDLSGLGAGIYEVVITSKNGQKGTKKVLVK